MNFSIEHDFDDLFEKMNNQKIFNANTFTSILKKTVKPLKEELDKSGPDSLRSFAKGNGSSYDRAAEASRAKYGELQKAIGIYKSRILKNIGDHAVNVGYLTSKQDKAFVAHFLNYGWVNAKSGKRVKTQWEGWMQRAEVKTMPLMKEIFDKEVTMVFETEMAKKFAKSKMRKKR
jgi:hypothetical protein